MSEREALVHQLTASEGKAADLQQHNDTLTTSLAELQQQLAAVQGELASSASKLEAAGADHTDITAKYDLLAKEVSILKEALAVETASKQTASLELTGLLAKHDELVSTVSALTAAKEALEVSEHTLKVKAGQLEGELESATATQAQLSSELSSLRESLNGLSSDKASIVSEREALVHQLTASEGKAADLQQHNDTLTTTLAELQQLNSLLQTDLSALKERHLIEVDGLSSSSQTALSCKDEEISQLRFKHSQVKSSLESHIIACEAELADLRKQSSISTKEIILLRETAALESEKSANASIEVKTLLSKADSSQALVSSLEATVLDLNDQILALTTETSHRSREVVQLKEDILERQSTIDDLQSTMATREAVIAEILNQSQDDLTAANEKAAKLEESHSSLLAQLSALQSELNALRDAQQSAELENDKDKLAKRLADVEASLLSSKETIGVLQMSIADHEKQKEDLTLQIESLNFEYNYTKNIHDDAEQELTSLRTQISNANETIDQLNASMRTHDEQWQGQVAILSSQLEELRTQYQKVLLYCSIIAC